MQDDTPILEKAGETFGYLREYVEKKIELYRLEVTEQVVETLSTLITSFLMFAIFGIVILFASLSAGFYLAEVLDSMWLAFLIITGFYALLALILSIFKRQLILNPILRMVIDLLRREQNNNQE